MRTAPSVSHAMHAFQQGDLTRAEFFVQIDRLLALDRVNASRLWDILGEEHARTTLPPDVYAQLRQRVEQQVEVRRTHSSYRGEETAVQTQPETQPEARMTYPSGSLPSLDGQEPVAPGRMKGVGDTLNNRFVLEECLGFGGMGTVYKALDLRKLEASDRKPYIAIKLLNVQFRGHPKSLIALQREARKAQTLAHPNIVAVYDFDRDGAMVYLTMEYLSGKPLSRTLRAKDFKGMPYDQAMPIVHGMGKALAYAHERGFVHCDFKPANVILTDAGEVKVIDFGIARVFRKQDEDAEATVFDPGSLGAMTPAYASPEMLDHLVPDPRDDVYALGCVTYEMLTGRHPFDRLAATQARDAGLKPKRPDGLGYRQWRTLSRALAFQREERTPSISEFLHGMRAERTASRPVAIYAALGGAGVVAMALIAFFALRHDWTSMAQYESGESGTAESTPQTNAPAPTTTRPEPQAPVLTADAVAPVLASVPCSALTSSINGATLQVQGYLSKSYGTARLKETLSKVPGLQATSMDVQLMDDKHCAVINLFAPYWVRSHQTGRSAAIHAKQANAEFHEGDFLVLDIRTPAYESYVNVDYYSSDGNVVHMVPSPRIRGNQAPPNYTATIGGSGNWVVSKPFGNDVAVLLVTPVPLFDGLRHEVEPATDYLHAVEQQLRPMADKYGVQKIAVDFVQVTTRPR